MSTIFVMNDVLNLGHMWSELSLPASITKAASKQTYYTIRLLADRTLIDDAYRAYGYFRWADDQLDDGGMNRVDRLAFVERQKALIDRCYRGEWPSHVLDEEAMLVDLIRIDHEKDSGLQAYIRNLMEVMAFDAGRRGRLISGEELDRYTHHLAVAVTEAMHYFIGHACESPHCKTRYLAVSAAHITHMLRDTLDDIQAGYFNIPREYVEANKIDAHDVNSLPYRKWVKGRIELARSYFKSGREYLRRVENSRCRVAGFAYVARFTGVLNTMEREDYRLRSGYPEYKSWTSALNMAWSAFSQAFGSQQSARFSRAL